MPVLVALAVALLVHGPAAAEEVLPVEVEVEGRVAALASSIVASADGVVVPPSVSVLLETAHGPLHVTLAPGARVLAAEGEPVAPGVLPLGARVLAIGEPLAPGQFLAYELHTLP